MQKSHSNKLIYYVQKAEVKKDKNIFYNIAKILRDKTLGCTNPELIMNHLVWMISLSYVLPSFKIDSHFKKMIFFGLDENFENIIY